MDARGGDFLYWTATSFAVAVAIAAVISYFLNALKGMPVVSVAAMSLAGIIWLSGWAARHIFVGR